MSGLFLILLVALVAGLFLWERYGRKANKAGKGGGGHIDKPSKPDQDEDQ